MMVNSPELEKRSNARERISVSGLGRLPFVCCVFITYTRELKGISARTIILDVSAKAPPPPPPNPAQ